MNLLKIFARVSDYALFAFGCGFVLLVLAAWGRVGYKAFLEMWP